MPLWAPYEEMLASDVADIGNAAEAPMAGAVTAALFLQKFVPEGTALGASRHLRLAAGSAKPGRPKGGDAFGLRAAWAALSAPLRRLTAAARPVFAPNSR